MDEAKIAQQGTQISTHTDVTGRKWGTLMVEGIVIASGYVCEQCGVIGCRIQHPPPDTSARHGGSPAVGHGNRAMTGPELREEIRAALRAAGVREGHGQDPAQDGAQAGSRFVLDRSWQTAEAKAISEGRAQPAPAQAAGGASGGHSLLNEREMDVLDDFLNAHRDDIEHGINDFGDLRPLLPWLDGKWPR